MPMPAQIAVHWEPFREVWVVLVHAPYMKGSTIVMDHKHYPFDTKEEADGAARQFADALVLAGRPKVMIIEDDGSGQPKTVWESE
jgi:hypothetical protein